MAAVTVVIDDDTMKKLRELHAKRVRKSMKAVSFSRIVNDVLKKGLKSS